MEFGRYNPRIDKKVCAAGPVGSINGLGDCGNSMGMVIDIEVSAIKAVNGKGSIKVTGIVEEEEMEGRGHKVKMSSSAKSSVENTLTVLRRFMDIDWREYDIHLNFPGGIPIDGPSAGVAIAVALYSAIKNIPIKGDIAMTGELSIRGKVKPVGGVTAKIEAAKLAGVKKVLIPKDNWQESYRNMGLDVIPVEDFSEILDIVFNEESKEIDEKVTAKIVIQTPPNIITVPGA